MTAVEENSPVIAIRDVVKQYRVRHERGRTLKEALLRQRIYQETINALDHVNLDISGGRTLGIIGSNGSGKSTLLKLIAGTSVPTSGTVEVNGRVSALLELGAGFHPDFSGRENVYLDGAIMGLPRQVIDERFDDIVAFAEMAEFIDAPAKTYSSGMYMRLAFAVAVSVDPDIILIDEVFAVGDESFQRKCLDKVEEFKSEGKTIVFVSHSLEAVRKLCDEAAWIDKGKLRAHGATSKVIDHYLWAVNEMDDERLSSEEAMSRYQDRWGTRRGEVVAVRLCDASGGEKHTFETGDRLTLRIGYETREPLAEPVIGMAIHRSDGVLCFGCSTRELGDAPAAIDGAGELSFNINRLDLLPGSYNFSISFHNDSDSETFDYHDRKYRFRVVAGPKNSGIFRQEHDWSGWPGGGESS